MKRTRNITSYANNTLFTESTALTVKHLTQSRYNNCFITLKSRLKNISISIHRYCRQQENSCPYDFIACLITYLLTASRSCLAIISKLYNIHTVIICKYKRHGLLPYEICSASLITEQSTGSDCKAPRDYSESPRDYSYCVISFDKQLLINSTKTTC